MMLTCRNCYKGEERRIRGGGQNDGIILTENDKEIEVKQKQNNQTWHTGTKQNRHWSKEKNESIRANDILLDC